MKEELIKIMAKNLNLNESDINEGTLREDISEWDSMNHLILMTKIEKHFNVKFTTDEINSIKSVNDVIKLIENKRHE